MNGRTDLAIEGLDAGFIYDVDRRINGMDLKKIYVDKDLSKKLGKREGYYYNIDNIDFYEKEKAIIKLLSATIKDIISNLNKCKSILVVGLGNDHITPDSLGPYAINKIEVNRHLEESFNYQVSAIAPGVMGQTGMETSEIVKAIVDDFKPDLVIIIDALACNDINRMCHSIQISTAGINPGSGVGNHRKELTKKTLGCEVVAIGIPTVCDLNNFIDTNGTYFVTPNNIDEAMDILSMIIAKGINKALL